MKNTFTPSKIHIVRTTILQCLNLKFISSFLHAKVRKYILPKCTIEDCSRFVLLLTLSDFALNWALGSSELYFLCKQIILALMVPTGLLGIISAFKIQRTRSVFIFSLALLLYLGSMVWLLVSSGILDFYGSDIFNNSSYLDQIGVLLELTLFYSDLGYRTKLLQYERIKYQKDIKELEVKALKAQMSPHFISNCLVSIIILIKKGESKRALEYLDEFTKLINLVVRYALEPSISLDLEIEICLRYVQLELLKFQDTNPIEFDYHIDDRLDTSFIEVPPFMIQPFIENAFKHAFPGDAVPNPNLYFSFTEEDGFVKCVVEDNGVGRANTKRCESELARPSLGMSNIRERVQLVNRLGNLYEDNIDVKVIDKQQPTGTKVEIKFPWVNE